MTDRRALPQVLMTLWPMRVLWVLLPLTVGRAVVQSLDGRSDAVQTTAEVGLWMAWFVGLVAVLAPSTVALTALRTVAPAALGVSVLALVFADNRTDTGLLLAVVYGLVVTAWALLPITGDPMINGSAYGSERRMALRPPAALLLGPVQLAWLAVFAAVVTGPLLVAAGNIVVGIVLCLMGVAMAVAGVRALHQLARRWIVFVPAGFVIHDYLSLAESILIQRKQKPILGPAPADLDGHLDLSGGALGLALTVGFDEEVPVALRAKGEVASSTANRFVFTPSLPGQLLQEARVRAITIA